MINYGWNSTLKRGKGFTAPKRPLKRSVLRARSTSDASLAKERIQALVRELAIARDGGCVLRRYLTSCTEILQAEHLITRANAATYGDMRNIVCLCTYHHLFWKPQHSSRYWSLIEEILGPARWAWLKQAEADKTPHKVDWKLVELDLKAQLQKLKAQPKKL